MQYLVIALGFGLATGSIGRGKRATAEFFIWFLVGAVLPLIGLVAVILYRSEDTEPERKCPTCNKVLKKNVQTVRGAGRTCICPTRRRSDRARASR